MFRLQHVSGVSTFQYGTWNRVVRHLLDSAMPWDPLDQADVTLYGQEEVRDPHLSLREVRRCLHEDRVQILNEIEELKEGVVAGRQAQFNDWLIECF